MFESGNDEDVKVAKAEAEAAKAEATAAKAERDSIAAEKAKVDEDYKKLKNVDHNFKRLRDMSEAEKDALTQKEIELQQQQEKLQDEQQQHISSVRSDWRQAAIEKASRGNADKAKEIEAALANVVGEETDRKSIEAKVTLAAKLVRKDNESVDPIGAAFSFGGSPVEKDPPKPEQTQHGDALSKLLGL